MSFNDAKMDEMQQQSINYKKLYDVELPEYKEIRKKGSEYRKKYLQEIDLWKSKYMRLVIPKNISIKTIIEIGCATGDLLSGFPLEVKSGDRFGIDISEKNIDFAKKNHQKINFICGTIDDINFQRNSFDLLILSDILEHVENDLEFLTRSSHLSKYIVVNIPLQKCLYYRNRQFGPNDEDGHLRAYSLKDVFSVFEKAGLKIVNYKQRYICKEDFFQRRIVQDYFSELNFLQSLIKMPQYFVLIILNLFFYKIYFGANLFAFLEKRQ